MSRPHSPLLQNRISIGLLGVVWLVFNASWAAAQAAPSCDRECAPGYVCELEQICTELIGGGCELAPVCSAVPCTSNVDCDKSMSCSENACVPTWLLECADDADCGAGFTCADQCGSGRGPDCELNGARLCFAETRPCGTDSECRDGWTCEHNPSNGIWANASTGEQGCTIVEPATLCVPPYAEQFGFGAGYLEWQTRTDKPVVHRLPLDQCSDPGVGETHVPVRASDLPGQGRLTNQSAASGTAASNPPQAGVDAELLDADPGSMGKTVASTSSRGCTFTSGPLTHSPLAPWGIAALGVAFALHRRRAASRR
jgi:hypothetical protein